MKASHPDINVGYLFFTVSAVRLHRGWDLKAGAGEEEWKMQFSISVWCHASWFYLITAEFKYLFSVSLTHEDDLRFRRELTVASLNICCLVNSCGAHIEMCFYSSA